MELSPRIQFTSPVEITQAQENPDLFVKSFIFSTMYLHSFSYFHTLMYTIIYLTQSFHVHEIS